MGQSYLFLHGDDTLGLISESIAYVVRDGGKVFRERLAISDVQEGSRIRGGGLVVSGIGTYSAPR